MNKPSIGRPGYTDECDGFKRELISKGDIKSFIIRIILLAILVITSIALCSLLQAWYICLQVVVVLGVIFLLSFFVYSEDVSEWLVFFWIFYIYKRIFGREGKNTSRLTHKERQRAAWSVTKQLFETRLDEPEIELVEFKDPA